MPSGPTPFQARFVTATQQVLALAVVCAALTPAVGVVSLDVVAQAPEGSPAALMSAYGEEALKTSKLPSGPVSADLREVQLTQPGERQEPQPVGGAYPRRPGRSGAGRRQQADQRPAGRHRLRVGRRDLGARHPAVRGRPRLRGAHPHRRIVVRVDRPRVPRRPRPRPRQRGGPQARPGTDPLLVGRVDQVQVRADAKAFLPSDMQLAVIAPGQPKRTVTARAAIDTSTIDGNDGSHSAYDASALAAAEARRR